MTAMKIRIILTTVIFMLLSLASAGQTSAEREMITEMKTEIDSILQSQVDLGKIPGAVVLVEKNNKVVYRKAYGYAWKYDYDHVLLDKPERMTVSHLFDIASLTKVVGTTTSVMLLADRGLLGIDDPVSKYVRAFDTPEKKDITIRHLLTHTAGLYEWYPMYYIASNRQESYRLIGELPLKFPVGEQRRYSDLGFVLLGQIIETVSGKSLEDFMETNIFRPLRMNHTAYNPLLAGNFRKIAATSAGNPYERRMVCDSTLGFTVKEIDPAEWNGWRTYILRGEVNDGNAWYANGGISGAAGLFSTAGDIRKLVDMLVNKGKTGSKQFVSEETIETFLTKDRFNNGLGWMMDPANSFIRGAPEGSFGHTGFTGTSISVVPDRNLLVILLINRQNTGLSEAGEYYNVSPVRLQVIKAVMKYMQ
jgi:CubicO group peptidase (beta-lactamase class C family)